jgi:lipopolysaccharide/colanic/teichoic acid biosynthesis glycosyltransferase
VSAAPVDELRPRTLVAVSEASGDEQLELVSLPAWKRGMDVVLSALALVVVSPLILFVIVAIRLESPGGAFYVHKRVGRGGVTFRCWKFRSMVNGADQERQRLEDQNEASGLIFKMRHDPRVTRVGWLLRRSSIDELPQLWNILKGDMSMVGPRPPLPEEVALYSARERRRLAATPGLTGLWQVTGRARHDFDEMIDLDLRYIERITFMDDLKIIVRTVRTVLKADGSY